MQELTLSSALTTELDALYQGLQADYERVASSIPLTCTDCPDNCCDSWFFHHTYSEWAYLWQGLRQLDAQTLARLTVRAEDYLRQSQEQLAAGQRPKIICPLNEQGRCRLYEHRLLVCRMHGIPATLTRPDGQSLRFPGCFRCQQIVEERYRLPAEAPAMNRTQLFSRMAALESRLTGGNRQLYPKIKKTLAELIVQGPPMVGGLNR